MKRKFFAVCLIAIISLLSVPALGVAQKTKEGKKAGMAKAKYLVTMPHTEAECLKALDDIVATNPKLLDKCWFGCMAGNHTGWATVDAKSEADARAMLPKDAQEKAQIVKVDKMTADQIKSFHEKKTD